RQRFVMSDNELYGAAAKLFAAHNRWEDVGEAEATGWAQQLWKALQQSGFSDVPVPEELGGAGGSVADAVQLLRAAGAHAAPVPLAESGLVGGWLLASAGLALPEGVRTVLPPAATLRLDGDRLFGTAPAVAWGHRAEHVVGLVGGVIVLAPGPAAQSGGPAVSRGANLADEPRDTVVFDGVPVTARADAPDAVTEETLWERTALGRAALMAGAISAVAAMTLRYSGERQQFGRPSLVSRPFKPIWSPTSRPPWSHRLSTVRSQRSNSAGVASKSLAPKCLPTRPRSW
ncbi:MAG: acyl-CoA dehydrogenase, partial [Mycobacterium sp.]|nr:acyl-CoA dehydrogenase [Mycobacterium sp.]